MRGWWAHCVRAMGCAEVAHIHGAHILELCTCCAAAQVKEEFIHDLDDLVKRNIMDGDPFYGPTPSHRFKSRETEPYMPSQARGAWMRTDAW